MNEDDKDRHGRTISDVILQNITLDCFLPVYVRPLPGIAFPSFASSHTSPSPAVKRAANAGSGKGVCQRRRRRRGGGGGLLCEAASTPVVRPSVGRPSSSLAQNPFAPLLPLRRQRRRGGRQNPSSCVCSACGIIQNSKGGQS